MFSLNSLRLSVRTPKTVICYVKVRNLILHTIVISKLFLKLGMLQFWL